MVSTSTLAIHQAFPRWHLPISKSSRRLDLTCWCHHKLSFGRRVPVVTATPCLVSKLSGHAQSSTTECGPGVRNSAGVAMHDHLKLPHLLQYLARREPRSWPSPSFSQLSMACSTSRGEQCLDRMSLRTGREIHGISFDGRARGTPDRPIALARQLPEMPNEDKPGKPCRGVLCRAII